MLIEQAPSCLVSTRLCFLNADLAKLEDEQKANCIYSTSTEFLGGEFQEFNHFDVEQTPSWQQNGDSRHIVASCIGHVIDRTRTTRDVGTSNKQVSCTKLKYAF